MFRSNEWAKFHGLFSWIGKYTNRPMDANHVFVFLATNGCRKSVILMVSVGLNYRGCLKFHQEFQLEILPKKFQMNGWLVQLQP